MSHAQGPRRAEGGGHRTISNLGDRGPNTRGKTSLTSGLEFGAVMGSGNWGTLGTQFLSEKARLQEWGWTSPELTAVLRNLGM